jgi:DNA repair protein RadC
LTDLAVLQALVGVREGRRLYRGSLLSVLQAPCPGHNANVKLFAAQELVKRALREGLSQRSVLDSPSVVRDLLCAMLSTKDHEVFAVLFLDAQHALVATEEMFRGTLTQTSVYPREVVKAALRHNAAAVILAHNHPSGFAEPSRADEYLTQTLKAALALVDVRVLDHIVVAGHKSVSLAERGLL